MTSSPPNKQFEGQTGFPTANAPPETNGCRVFVIPSDEEYFAQFMAAVDTLTDEWRYFRNGDLTAAENVAVWQSVIDTAMNTSIEGQCSPDIEAPYWDDADGADADDTAPVDDQPWYGEIVVIDDRLTWKENIAIWAVTAFIALSGKVGAAIAFLPVARNFVVEARTSPVGGFVRFLFNGIEIGKMDTYSAVEGVRSMPIALPAPSMSLLADEDDNKLWVEMSDEVNPAVVGDPNIQVVRMRLAESDFAPTNLRYNSDCDCIQFSPDGGDTWNPAPDSDPRTSPTFLRPPRGSGDVQCDSAANQVEWIKDFIDQLIAAGAVAGEVFYVVNLMLDFLSVISDGFTLLLEGITSAASDIAGIGSVLLAASFTSDQYDALLCIFFCNADSSGLVTPDGLVQIESDVTAQLNTTAALVVNLILAIQGNVGLSNAGRIGAASGDCSGCACRWCYTVDLTADAWLLTVSVPPTWSDPFGHWEDGVGYVSDLSHYPPANFYGTLLELNLNPMPAGNYMFIDVDFYWVAGSPAGSTYIQVDGDIVTGGTIPGGDNRMRWSGNVDNPTALNFQLNPGFGTSPPGGSVVCTKITLQGVGDNPFGDDNCP